MASVTCRFYLCHRHYDRHHYYYRHLHHLSFTYKLNVLFSDLRVYYSQWKFDEAQGNTTYDLTRNVAGPLVNIAQTSWVQGVYSTALLMQAASDNSQSGGVSLNQSISLTSSFTLNFWTLPSAAIVVDTPGVTENSGFNRSFAFLPMASFVPSSSSAALYVAAGTNAVAVYARTNAVFTPILVWTGLCQSFNQGYVPF